jgi:glutathione peroxidase
MVSPLFHLVLHVSLITMSLNDIALTTLTGQPTTFGSYSDKVVLVVNVASRCGLSPQYQQLEELQKKYGSRGFTVVGVPSNQFLQELKNSDDIAEYCSTTWGVTFPMMEKASVNGRKRHPLYVELVKAKDSSGKAGPVMWNFEKFLVLPSGEIKRFRPTTKPDNPEIISAIEAALPN